MSTPNKDDMLNKVRALLAKAEGTDSDHEAEALTAKAAELMAKYGIDEAMATQRDHGTAKPGSKVILVDAPYAGPKASLLNVVAKAFRCRAVELTGRDKTQLKVHLFGFESDMEMVEILFTSLLLQATHGAVRVESQTDYYGRSRTRSARSSYILGFASAVQGRLAKSTAKAEAETSGPARRWSCVAARSPSTTPWRRSTRVCGRSPSGGQRRRLRPGPRGRHAGQPPQPQRRWHVGPGTGPVDCSHGDHALSE